MTTYYLRNFVESVSEMPAELARKFKLMRELDEKAQSLQAESESLSRRRLEEAAQKVFYWLALFEDYVPLHATLLHCTTAKEFLLRTPVTGTCSVFYASEKGIQFCRQRQQRHLLLPNGFALRKLLLRALPRLLQLRMRRLMRTCGR